MGQTSIEWTDRSINPIRARDPKTNKVGHHCEKVSAGCQHCYASRLQTRFGLPEFSGPSRRDQVTHFLDESKLQEVLRRKVPTKWFWCDMSDLFGEWVPDGWVMRCLDVWAHTYQHTHQILTKRPERMRNFFLRWADLTGEVGDPNLVRGPEATRQAHPSPRGQLFAAMLDAMGEPPPGEAYPTFDWMEGMINWPDVLPNVWLGISVEDQQTADERNVLLQQTPAAVRFWSYEPALGPVVMKPYCPGCRMHCLELHGRSMCCDREVQWPSWVIAGGESGPDARPFDIQWARSMRDQCRAAGVPFFLKQFGENVWENGGYLGLNAFTGKGGVMSEWPADLQVREFPEVR